VQQANILAVYKPKGPTSHDIIDQLRRITGVKKVGHAGTLDPLAEGVLVVGIGRSATKQLWKLARKDKEYLATIRLGATSTTDDAEGIKNRIPVKQPPTENQVKQTLQGFIGVIDQVPPVFSAIKIKGRPAHRLARAGKQITLKTRKVVIYEIGLLEYKWPTVALRVVTGSGVYIRSLARDLGEKLKTGGYLEQLTRTRVGSFTLKQAVRLSQFAAKAETLLSQQKVK
jgi:tRNA pseudouridine55 synthase